MRRVKAGRRQHLVQRNRGIRTMRMVHWPHQTLVSKITNGSDILDHLMSLGRPGAGLRSVESSVAEMEHIFDRIFGVENGKPLLSESDESIVELLQTYGSDEDMYATCKSVATDSLLTSQTRCLLRLHPSLLSYPTFSRTTPGLQSSTEWKFDIPTVQSAELGHICHPRSHPAPYDQATVDARVYAASKKRGP
jgi:hypothetical protein